MSSTTTMAASPHSCQASFLYSSLLPGTCTCNSLSFKQARWNIVQNPHPPLTKNKSKLLKQQGTSQKQRVDVHAEYNDKKGGGAVDFVAGFVLGGVVFGALGYLFAPQVNKLLFAIDRELDEPSRKLPKGLDDDEGLEKTRRNLNEKIAQLNAAIDDVSAQLRADDQFGGQAESAAELESAA